MRHITKENIKVNIKSVKLGTKLYAIVSSRARETILPEVYSAICKGAQGSQQEGPAVP